MKVRLGWAPGTDPARELQRRLGPGWSVAVVPPHRGRRRFTAKPPKGAGLPKLGIVLGKAGHPADVNPMPSLPGIAVIVGTMLLAIVGLRVLDAVLQDQGQAGLGYLESALGGGLGGLLGVVLWMVPAKLRVRRVLLPRLTATPRV